MKVRAKFRVHSVVRTDFGSEKPSHSVLMYPVTEGSDEDKAFWEATPSGKIELDILNQTAAEQFKAGQTYYVDFTPAE